MTDAKKRVPALRFPEFEGEWDQLYGRELFANIVNKNHNSDLPLLAISQEYGAIPRDLIDYKISVSEKGIEGYKVINKGDFIISLRSFQGGIEYSNYDGLCSPAYIILRPKINLSRIFYKHFFKTPSYIISLNKKLEGIRDGKMISYKYFSEIYLPFPEINEQKKVACFLSSITNRIDLIKSKRKQLIAYKRRVMQLIFTRQLRIRDSKGNYYPEWVEKKLSDLGTTYNGLSGKSGEDFGRGKLYIQYKQIFDNSKIDITECGYVEVEPNEKQWTVQYGDIFFTVSSETPKEVGFSSVLTDNIEEKIYLNSFSFGFRPKSIKEIHPPFARYLFRADTFRDKIERLAQGSTRYNMSKSGFLKLKVDIPSIEEQQKIANFLSAIDNKIELCEKQIADTEKFKKGLLQQMFV